MMQPTARRKKITPSTTRPLRRVCHHEGYSSPYQTAPAKLVAKKYHDVAKKKSAAPVRPRATLPVATAASTRTIPNKAKTFAGNGTSFSKLRKSPPELC